MPISHIIHEQCPECGKAAKEKSHFVAMLPKSINGKIVPQRTKVIILECGHTITEEKLEIFDFKDETNFDGSKHLFPFQSESCRLAVKASFKVLFRLDMGLGKTIIAA